VLFYNFYDLMESLGALFPEYFGYFMDCSG
jgi:hypothetical protein